MLKFCDHQDAFGFCRKYSTLEEGYMCARNADCDWYREPAEDISAEEALEREDQIVYCLTSRKHKEAARIAFDALRDMIALSNMADEIPEEPEGEGLP